MKITISAKSLLVLVASKISNIVGNIPASSKVMQCDSEPLEMLLIKSKHPISWSFSYWVFDSEIRTSFHLHNILAAWAG